ncbi:MAG: hypothetical protein ACQEP6_02670 [Patescibacteria group bacterium]
MKEIKLRLVYLYLFSLVGLVLVIIGSVQLINLGLTTWVFTEADEVNVYPTQKMPDPESESEVDPEEEKRMEEERAEYLEKERTARRQRKAAEALAMIIVGLPLYLYHWNMIRKERS